MSQEKSKKSKIPFYASLGIIISLFVLYFLVPSVREFLTHAWDVLTSEDEARIKEWISGFGYLGPLVLVLAMVLQMFLIIIPTVLLMVVSVLAYGPVWGSLIIFVAVACASSVGYFIGRFLGEGKVGKLIGGKTERKISKFIEDYGFWAVVITRLNPFLSNDAISFVAGILRMGYLRFMGATLLGIAPLTIFLAIIGQSTQTLKTGLLWGSLVSLAGFAAYVWWDKKRKKDQG
ncbi:TVP38/TMEM64 family protein [Zeaxanthinibacter enoshimensis]|uniref:TVP38/TMEM64 family membrane protein n=1 Tax=Zeaxanthinibacter enoshimensis TaxID=392009 RepID=A0A4R6TIE0_9FLAO|nr:TVP38/TMEM64 family protein [Zeaxanthinibacter enoshimensis]TDQ30594.1 putative membrane protein YdjX (TVP38/TMEM64 family) [Zeaxanthinibacter enoshimensis]